MRCSRLDALALALTLMTLICATRPAAAAWPHDPNNGNVALCTATNDQSDPKVVSDGAGGAIVTWYDFRSGVSTDIYAQRIDAAGMPQWTADGVALCTIATNEFSPMIVSDGAGGAIVTWYGFRNGSWDIYAQRINAAGVPQWAANGVAVCAAVSDQYVPTIVSDGAGGAIVTWYDHRSGSADIYAQRVNASGVPQWTADGVAMCVAVGNQFSPAIASDGAGGAVVTWHDYRSGPIPDIYAQRISAAGVPQWTANGVALCTAANDQYGQAIIPDGAGGAIVTWHDYRSGAGFDVYAQRISAAGAPQWAADGVALCTAASFQQYPTIASDGAGGAVVSWSDLRSGTTYDIYAQRISAAGMPQWTANGVALCTATNDQTTTAIVSDGAGGALVTWHDGRSGNTDIYAQRINAAGVPQWTADGVALCTAVSNQGYPTIASDGAGGAVVTWYDSRNGTTTDIYAQRIERFGKLGSPEPEIASVLDIPNDQGGRVRLAWDASYLDLENDADLSAYDLFHSVPPNLAQEAIARGEGRSLRLGEPAAGDGRAYLFTALGTEQFAWEYVSTVLPQHFISTYGSTQTTTGDSTADANPTTGFMVVGRNTSGSKYWLSIPVSGYSVDNLPPVAPAPFTGHYNAGTTLLHWNPNTELDLAGYRLYRGSSSGFVPSESNLIAAPPDTGYADAAGGVYWYKLTAVDTHGNESLVATLGPGSTVGVPGAPAASFFLARIAPNPAAHGVPSTVRFGLARAGSARLTVIDASGRRVRTLLDASLPAGEHQAQWDGRLERGQRAPAGLYFVQFEAEGRHANQRVVLMD